MTDRGLYELPEDLDITAYRGPYQFPNINRRRIAALLYGIIGLLAAVGWIETKNSGALIAAIVLAAVALYYLVCSWNLRVDQYEALARASSAVGFPVGHASAQLAWRGLRSRPTWRILLYSTEEPPTTRGLAEIDGVDGEVISTFTQPNPEDWLD